MYIERALEPLDFFPLQLEIETHTRRRSSRAAAVSCVSVHRMKKTKRRGKDYLKAFEKQKNNLVCNPDFKLLVALGAPRSGFLADFQPPGASKSPAGLKLKKSNQHIHKNTSTYIYIYICTYIHISI
jgi:hypothetical protein